MHNQDLTTELNSLREENARLKELLQTAGIPFDLYPQNDIKVKDPEVAPTA